MFRRILFIGMFIWNLFAASDSIFAQSITSWASGLGKAVSIVSAGDSRLFIVEQAGLIKIVDGRNNVLPTPFLDVSEIILKGGERGLLNLAFHPNYASNGLFYIYYTSLNRDITVAEYSVSSDRNIADPNGTVIISISHRDFANHNGGGLKFGPDGFLYLSTGDGGSGGDPSENAQNLGLLLGKILRIDVGSQTPQTIDFNGPADIALWDINKGSWNVASGNLTTTTTNKAEIVSDLPSCNGTLKVDLTPVTPGTRISLLVCYLDNKNYTEIRLLEDKDKMYIRQFSNNKKVADKKANLSIETGDVTHLKVTFDGRQFQIFTTADINPLLTMESGGPAAGSPGVRVKSIKDASAIANIDNLEITTPYSIPATNPFLGNSAARDEIWAYGLRNPWRFTFDRLTGDMIIGDVGQNCYEEVNFESASSSGGVNYGWDFIEARRCYDEPSGGDCNLPSTCGIGNFGSPILVYDHTDSAVCSVTGGYRYRGSAISSLSGKYIFGDFCSGRVYVATENGGNWNVNVSKPLFDIVDFSLSSFGEDSSGELYFTDSATGQIYKIVP